MDKSKGKKMKNLVLTAVLVLFSMPAFAGSCVSMAQALDEKIAQVQQLRDDAMRAHDNGDHAQSVELFELAMKLFKS
jgi:hypothetical protein